MSEGGRAPRWIIDGLTRRIRLAGPALLDMSHSGRRNLQDISHLESPDEHVKKHVLLAFPRDLTGVLKVVENHLP